MTSQQPYILVFLNKEMVAMLVYQTKPLGSELHFHANFFLLWCEIKMAAGNVSENALKGKEFCPWS